MLYVLNIILKLFSWINKYLLNQIYLLSVRKKYKLTRKRVSNILIKKNKKLIFLILKQLIIVIKLTLFKFLKKLLRILRKYLKFFKIKLQLNYFYIVYNNLKIDRFLRFNTIDFIRHYLEFLFFYLENKFKKLYHKLKSLKNTFSNYYIMYLFEIVFLRISLLIFYFYSIYKIFINNLFLVDTPFDAVMSPDRKEFERSNWTRFIPIPFLETVEFIVRPYWRYINTFQRSLINFIIINRLVYYLFFGEILSKLFFLVNKKIKNYFILFKNKFRQYAQNFNYTYTSKCVIYFFLVPFNRLNYVFISFVLHFKFIINLIFNFFTHILFLPFNIFNLIKLKKTIIICINCCFKKINNFDYILNFLKNLNLNYKFIYLFNSINIKKYKNILYFLRILFNISLLFFMTYVLLYYYYIFIYLYVYMFMLLIFFFFKYPNKNIISFFKSNRNYKLIGHNIILLNEFYRIEINYLLFALKKKYITRNFYEIRKQIIQYNYYFYKKRLIKENSLFSLIEQKSFNINCILNTNIISFRTRAIYFLKNLKQLKIEYNLIDNCFKLNLIFLNHLYYLVFLYSISLINFKDFLNIYKHLYLNYEICCNKLNYTPLYKNLSIFYNFENLQEDSFFNFSNNYLSLIYRLHMTKSINYNYLFCHV